MRKGAITLLTIIIITLICLIVFGVFVLKMSGVSLDLISWSTGILRAINVAV